MKCLNRYHHCLMMVWTQICILIQDQDPILHLPSPSPAAHSSQCLAPPAQPKRNYHPWLIGEQGFFNHSLSSVFWLLFIIVGRPCDEQGEFLPQGTPPPPRSNPGPDDWDPFEDEVQFLTEDFLFCQEEMSAGNINILLDLWALNMAKHDDLGPFSSYEHMYATINSIKLGDAL